MNTSIIFASALFHCGRNAVLCRGIRLRMHFYTIHNHKETNKFIASGSPEQNISAVLMTPQWSWSGMTT